HDHLDVLKHGVRRAGIPALTFALLRRPELDVLVELGAQEAPALNDVLNQRVGLVLRQHADPPDAGVDAVRQWEIDVAVLTAERQRRLAVPARERPETGAVAAGHDHCERLLLKIPGTAGTDQRHCRSPRPFGFLTE